MIASIFDTIHFDSFLCTLFEYLFQFLESEITVGSESFFKRCLILRPSLIKHFD
jgi:hypothetical protein